MRDDMNVVCQLDQLLADRGMTVAELSQRVGVTPVNLSILKNNRAKAVRFSTLIALCEVLGVQVGDLFAIEPDPSSPTPKGDPS